MEIEEITLSEWAEALPDAGFEFSHAPEVLRVIDTHAKGELRLFGGFRGQQPVGLFPVVVRKELFATLAVSPPPGVGLPRMGPLLMPTSPKRRSREKLNKEFTRQILETLDVDDPLTLFGAVCGTRYADPRPYRWLGFDVETLFTYSIDLGSTTPDAVKNAFSSTLRKEIHNAQDTDAVVVCGGVEEAHDVYDAHEARRTEQGGEYSVSWEYTRDLVRALDDRLRVYVAETPDGEFLNGITVLYSNDEAYYFQGGVEGAYQDASVNNLLHWHVIEDILTDPALDPIRRYDMGNANMEGLSWYKSQYGGDLVPYYLVKSGKFMDLAQRVYEMLTY